MTESGLSVHFDRIKKVIEYLQSNHKTQPTVTELARIVNVSPDHLQRSFKEWAGINPKQFQEFLTVQHAKRLLRNYGQNLFETADDVGLSGTSRLHDHFITIEAMTPGQYKSGGEGLVIHHANYSSRFGLISVGSTDRGICHLQFVDDIKSGRSALSEEFPKAQIHEQELAIHEKAISFFNAVPSGSNKIHLHLKGTPFQVKVWQALLSIPASQVTTYGRLAEAMNLSGGSRAVGQAVGKNPIAALIPCHRVIRSNGGLGGYRWGLPHKTALLAWESSRF